MTALKWRQLFSFPGRVIAWLLKAWLQIATLAINTAAISFAWFWPEQPGHEDCVRLAAVVLQILGSIAVIWGVLATRHQFGLEGVWSALLKWIRAFPTIFPKPVSASGAATIGAKATGHISLTARVNEELPLEEQMRQVVRALSHLHNENQILHSRIQTIESEMTSTIEKERRRVSDEIDKLRNKLTTFATGGIDLTLWGAVCFLVGGILGTLPHGWF